MSEHGVESAPTHELMVITSVQGYCRCGGWGMATDGGLERLRTLHAAHANPPEISGDT